MSDDTAIAVIGVGCRFPDAWNAGQFWRNIADGKVAVRDLDPARLRAAGLTDEVLDSPDYVTRAAGIPGAEEFAAEFFGYSAGEAEATDPQQRVFLEACWEALESAGRPHRGSPLVTGVFAGCSPSTYMTALHAGRALEGGVLAAVDDVALHLGGLGDFLASRVAYKLDLRGPSVGVQTACSSSLTAVHYAVLSLLSGECDMALAGGATVNEPLLGYRYRPGGLQSRDGYCRPFDARSTGTSFSSGVGVVALRRLGDALAEGDPVLAVVHGTAVGNDGSARSGFTAPSPAGLADVVASALEVAGVRGTQLRYVEAHGSGTPLGDQIELRGLTEGVRAGEDGSAEPRTGYCALGSVKANIGHCGPAAGIAGLIKAVQVARTGHVPPHPLYERPRNPGVLADSPFTISAEPGLVADDERFVLVNSMGLGGTNATAVLGPPPAATRAPAPERDRVRLVLSARTAGELDALARDMADALESGAATATDAAHTLRVGRVAFAERRVVTAAPGALPDALRHRAPGTPRPAQRVRLLVTAGEEVAEPVVGQLTLALRGRCDVVADPGDRSGHEDGFTVVVGDGEPAPRRHVLDPRGDAGTLADRIDEAVTAAWLHGADVAWEVLADGRGRRVPLPTYPFTRTRHWALDRLPPVAVPPAAAPGAAADDSAGQTAVAVSDDPVEADLLGLWRELFGVDALGLDDEFAALGGDSLTAMRIEAAVQRRHGVSVNVYRAGGGRATVRRLARVVTGLKGGGESPAGSGPAGHAPAAPHEPADEAGLLTADLALDLGRPATAVRSDAPDALLTTATDLLGTFVLHELLRTAPGRVHCLVPAADEREARELLRARAAAAGLPEPAPERVPLLLGRAADLGKLLDEHDDGRIGRVVHRAEPAGATGSYARLRGDALPPLAGLLAWMRRAGAQDFTCLSSLAACGTALGGEGAVQESRDQPLEPGADGPATVAWATERLLERAEEDGMRVRVFRTGLLLGAAGTGACDPADPLWRLLAGSLAVGAHPRDDRPLAVAPVDLVARAVAELSLLPGSVGRAYHLVDATTVTPAALCELLAEGAGATRAVPGREWQRAVALRALDRENEALDPLAPRRLRRYALGGGRLEAHAWSGWLARQGHDPAPTRELLWRCLDFAAAHHPAFAGLLAEHTRTQGLK
ncbi:beta-ketoacyl synthase N-terminal-like domain-containing protein [Streptomyces sp. NPDC049837]|uniref:beta-ketoacyl synthase N-terminal-like domain-containing protein n=1 Tax=Streptomyces sp. NPDC049837 TaxID=3155277 RepID=UPI00344ACAC6